jgi:RimJ/RimL family protein N-acetyltransferase
MTLSADDINSYLECHRDDEAKKNFMSVPEDLKEARKEVRHNSKDGLMLKIEAGGRFAGFIRLELNKNPRYRHSAIAGYGIHPGFRGRGLATKALRMVSAYGFKKLKLVRITGMCRTFNRASARVLEKAGFKLEGILRKNKLKDGKYLDDMLWAKVRQ